MKSIVLVLIFTLAASASAMPAPDYAAAASRFRETLSSLVQADTTNPPGNESRAVKILAARLRHEDIAYKILDFGPGRQNIVARIKATAPDAKLKPLLLLAHLDVVGTKDQNWTVPQHQVTEKDGFLYGRGVLDDLGMAVANLETFILLKQQAVPLKRDVILAFTGDEESGGQGIRTLLNTNPELLDAGIALNEGGALMVQSDGKIAAVRLQVAEKIYQDFILTAHGPTGHSSVPQKDNPIYRLSEALARLGNYKAEERLIPVTRAAYKAGINEDPKMAQAMHALAASKGKLPAAALKVIHQSPLLSAPLSTTCVATMLEGGTKVNALPSEAHAMVNCRILPDETVAQVKARLEKIVNDAKLQVELGPDNGASGASPLEGEIPSAVRALISELYPVAVVIPTMASGATDSRFLREKGIEAYGLSPLALHDSDVIRAHGIDERIPTASIQPGLEFMYRLVVRLAGTGML